MTLELWNTFATFGTFVVIAATAIAALVQLRHARGSNQIAAIAELQDGQNTPDFIGASQFVRTELATKLKDPEFRFQITNFSARTAEAQALTSQSRAVGNYYEHLGLLVRMELVDRDLALNLWSTTAVASWDELKSYTSITRRRWGNAVWENFEYFVVLSQDWLATHPEGDFPTTVRRIALKDEWLEADTQYEASRVPA